MRTVSRVMVLCACVGFATLGPARPAHAQRGEAELPVRPFGLRELNGWLEFEYEDETLESRSTAGAPTRESTFRGISEELQINTRSYIYHPYLADIVLQAGLDLQQAQREEPDANNTQSDDDFFADNVLADVTLLKRQPVITNLFYQRFHEEETRETFDSFEVDRQAYGGAVTSRNEYFPSTLRIEQREVEGTGLNRENEEVLEATFDSTNITGPLDSRLRATYEDRDDIFRRTNTQETRLNLFQELMIGESHTWNSGVLYVDQTGTTQVEQLDVRETGRFRLADRWLGRVTGVYQTFDREETSLDTWSALAEVSHHLYDSLDSAASVYTQESSSTFTDSNQQYGELRLNYRKNIPVGLLSANVSVRQSYFSEDSTGLTQVVFDEAHTFGIQPVFLDNPNVVLDSVLVTDGTGLVQYVEGIDYLLVPRGTLIEVQRLATGGIPVNGTILVDYEYTVASELDYESLAVGATTRLTLWRWLALYGRLQNDDKTVTKGEALDRVQDVNTWLVGAEVSYDGLTTTMEYENFDSGLTVYDRSSVRLAYGRTIYADWYTFANVDWSLTSFTEPNEEDLTVWQARGGVRGKLYRDVIAEFDGWYRTESGRKTSPNLDEQGVRAFLEWPYRLWRGRLSLAYALQEDEGGRRQERQEITVSVRRWF